LIVNKVVEELVRRRDEHNLDKTEGSVTESGGSEEGVAR
jgi:hypothetical protein